MKLFLCRECGDMVKFALKIRKCECGATKGKYLPDGDKVEIKGNFSIIGLSNKELRNAVNFQTCNTKKYLTAWIFENNYSKVTVL